MLERETRSNVVEVLERVLDKGIVIDAWVRVSLVGIDLITVEARVVVASIATYLQYSETVAQMGGASQPSIEALRQSEPTSPKRRRLVRPRQTSVSVHEQLAS